MSFQYIVSLQHLQAAFFVSLNRPSSTLGSCTAAARKPPDTTAAQTSLMIFLIPFEVNLMA
jgi:hypothetical protein